MVLCFGDIRLTVFLLLAVATVVVGAVTPTEIRIRRGVAVDEQRVTLGDVAVVTAGTAGDTAALGALSVGSFTPGEDELVVGRSVICRVLTQNGYVPGRFMIYGASRCRATFAGAFAADISMAPPAVAVVEPVVRGEHDQPVQPTVRDRLEGMIHRTLRRFPAGSLRIEWTLRNQALLAVAAPEDLVKIELRAPIDLGRVHFVVKLPMQTSISTNRSEPAPPRVRDMHVRGQVYYLCQSLVARRDLAAGEVITAEDIMSESRRVSSLNEVGMTEAAAVIGQEAARRIRRHQVISSDAIRSIKLVKARNQVTVSAQTGGVSIYFYGVAVTSGALGEIVSVRNEGNGRVVRAVVTGAGTVAVQSAAPVMAMSERLEERR